ncbi:MAG: hypothetical protein JW966_05675 [Anaerolineae bacterium]|nr:hypothetical protein [Anaerolineae bacterium]
MKNIMIITYHTVWRVRRLVGLPVLIAVLLSGCGGEDESAPELAVLPTRTPVPATDAPVDEPSAHYEVVSLQDEVNAYLAAADAAGALDRIDLFREHVIQQAPECAQSEMWPEAQPLELFDFNLVEVDNVTWHEVVDTFPEDGIMQVVSETMEQTVPLLPPPQPVRICLVPVPRNGPPEDQPDGGVNVIVFSDDLIIIACSAGSLCLDYLPDKLAFFYSYAYQVGQTGWIGGETPLLGFAVYFGRGTDFARQINPDAVFAWDDALTPEKEADVWSRMQEFLLTTYQDWPEYRNVNRFMYGDQDQDRFPAWGGAYIGTQIVSAYRERHPDVSLVELAALPPDILLADSGYTP